MAVFVASPQMDAPCTEMWADPTELAVITGDPDAEAVAIEATYILWVLSGQKYHGYQTWVEDYLLTPEQNKIALPKWPVQSIISVSTLDSPSVSGVETAVTDWTWDGRYLHLTPSYTTSPFFTDVCVSQPRHTRVKYRLAPYLAPGADRVVKRLAEEYWKARCGDGSCKLPERITSVTRQGVSWTILDPQDFLTMGRIGIGSIDHWLATVNRNGVVKALDPYYSPTVLHSVQTGCSAVT